MTPEGPASEDAPIYLDHNATTPILPEVVDAMLPYLTEHFGNPSSGHVYGVRARRAVQRARGEVAALLGCEPDEIVFTSGGTESNNLAIRGVPFVGERVAVVTSEIEHPAVASPCAWLERRGRSVTRLAVDEGGRVRAEEAAEHIHERCALVTVMHSNNETGVCQPVRQLAELAHAAGALMHTDAAQSCGKLPVRVRALQVDLLTLAGHKLYAPKGVGALYVRRGLKLRPFALGGGHEAGLRPGTENVASIVGLGVACRVASRDLDDERVRLSGLRDRLWAELREGAPGLRLNGHLAERLPNTLNVSFPGVLGSELLSRAKEIAASTGSACHAGEQSASPVLVAMGVPEREALGSIRLSLGRSTTADDVERAANALLGAWRELSERR